MQPGTERPEPFAAWELQLSFPLPAFRVMPDRNRGAAISQVHNAAGIQLLRIGEGEVQMPEDAGMASPRLETGDLGCTNVEGVGTASKGAGATSQLVMGLQQGDGKTFSGQQCTGGETGDASADHNDVPISLHPGMLAAQASDLWMLDALRSALDGAGALLQGTHLAACQALGGGCSQQAWKLTLSDGRHLFAKQGKADMLQAEQRGLAALHAMADPADLVVPEPLELLPTASDSALLLLPWLDLVGSNQASLGRGLARLHRESAARGQGGFGWDTDGFIGLGPQPAGWRHGWGEAFVDLRLRPQLRLARGCGFQGDADTAWLEALSALLDQHHPCPSLVHGDLWGGNAGVSADGRGVILDPACWWADREVDLAMTHLFGGFSRSFYDAYMQEWPLDPGASERIAIYNLYHLLNHANLFGGGYRRQSVEAIRQLQRRLG